ncbi:metallophosphoesterase [Trichothermofontia sichuanensis B231]|uniref:metallophosphoesterase family protein n=1 Tax=Trichothermofontia sichuanensis TaxID=3045816 RepID=UPI002248288F|nr:metallophosphoesterase [Trichothermofontia sichuanensis]UZQ54412.1 metallophosphoesterase [Trichothermofontia sichuanensis B231]
MPWKRRRFLYLGGLACGGGLAAIAQRLSPSVPLAATAPRATFNLAQSRSPAPTGLFAPRRGDVRLVVISDLNSQYGSVDYEPEVDRAIQLIPDWQPDLVLCGGDMVAGQKSTLTVAQIQAMWAAFDRRVAAPLRRAKIPFGFTIGNHDASGALNSARRYLFDTERQLAAAYWRTPAHDPGLTFVDRAHFPFYYTFQQQQIFYLVWDASTAEIPEAQLTWVAQSLGSPAAQAARLRIVIGHLPLYAVAVGRDHPGEFLNQAERLRSLLEHYHVHTYISGHQHAYFPGHRGELDLLHAGALGSGPRPLLQSNLPPSKTLTIVDVHLANAATDYTTYDMKTLQVIDQQQLPRRIDGPNGWVLRRDIPLTGKTAQAMQAI